MVYPELVDSVRLENNFDKEEKESCVDKNESFMDETEITWKKRDEDSSKSWSPLHIKAEVKDVMFYEDEGYTLEPNLNKDHFASQPSRVDYDNREDTLPSHMVAIFPEVNADNNAMSTTNPLKPHINNNHVNLKKHKCPLCDYSATRKGTLDRHVNGFHLNIKNHHCQWCDFSSTLKDNLEHHVTAVHLQLKNHKCQLCDYSTNQKGHLKQHVINMHLKKKKHKCQLCDYSSTRKSDLTSHVDAMHLKVKNYNCDLGDFITNEKSHLMDGVPLEVKNEWCGLDEDTTTPQGYPNYKNDSGHLNRKDPETGLYDYSGTTSGAIYQTGNVNSKEKNQKCLLCDYSTSSKINLNIHVDIVHLHLKNYKCHQCDYSTIRKNILKRHIDSIHLQLKNQKCHICDFSTNQKGNLTYHINSVHLKAKNHKCHLCEYSANQSCHLKRHIDSVHLGVKKHKCYMCEYSTSQKGSLKTHINNVHMDRVL